MECRSYLSFQKLFWTVLGCVLPARVDGIRGYAPTQGRSPGMIRGATSGGAEPPPHIGRHSRELEFPHSLGSDRLRHAHAGHDVYWRFVEYERKFVTNGVSRSLGACRRIRLCGSLCDLCASVVSVFLRNSTTETQRFTEVAQRNPFSDRLLDKPFNAHFAPPELGFTHRTWN